MDITIHRVFLHKALTFTLSLATLDQPLPGEASDRYRQSRETGRGRGQSLHFGGPFVSRRLK